MEEGSRSSCVGPRSDSSTLNTQIYPLVLHVMFSHYFSGFQLFVFLSTPLSYSACRQTSCGAFPSSWTEADSFPIYGPQTSSQLRPSLDCAPSSSLGPCVQLIGRQSVTGSWKSNDRSYGKIGSYLRASFHPTMCRMSQTYLEHAVSYQAESSR